MISCCRHVGFAISGAAKGGEPYRFGSPIVKAPTRYTWRTVGADRSRRITPSSSALLTRRSDRASGGVGSGRTFSEYQRISRLVNQTNASAANVLKMGINIWAKVGSGMTGL